jgi:hypothetical protein
VAYNVPTKAPKIDYWVIISEVAYPIDFESFKSNQFPG